MRLCLLALLSTILLACNDERLASLEQRVTMLEKQVVRDSEPTPETATAPTALSAAQVTMPSDAATSQAVVPATYNPDKSELDDPFLGNKDAEVLVMIFSDFYCRPCRRFFNAHFSALEQAVTQHGNSRLVFRDFPLATYSGSRTAAQAAHCAGEQGQYWQYFRLLYSETDAFSAGEFSELASMLPTIDRKRFEACLKSDRYANEITLDVESASALGVQGAPAFFIGKRSNSTYSGVLIRGAQPLELLLKKLAEIQQS